MSTRDLSRLLIFIENKGQKKVPHTPGLTSVFYLTKRIDWFSLWFKRQQDFSIYLLKPLDYVT